MTRWTQTKIDGVTVHKSPEGHEVFKDHEWLDRLGNDEEGYRGEMHKRDGFRLVARDGKEDPTLYPTLKKAKQAARRLS